jgi:hypothetical protein
MMMKLNVRALAAAAVLFLAPLLAAADPLAAGTFNGHYYEVYAAPAPNYAWSDADQAALLKSHAGVAGHLATLTSKAEDDFVESLRASSGVSPPEVWAGGFQTACTPPAAACGWSWVNDDGPIGPVPGTGVVTFTNWQVGEPNDYNGTDEKYLGIGHDSPGWNDEGYFSNIGGFVVEYDVPKDATGCADAGGCETTTGETLTLPDKPDVDDPTIGVRTYFFTDDPNRCGKQPLSLFEGKLVIPAYLCGSPDFVVVKTDPNFDVPSGTVVVENDLSLFPNNTANLCSSPITGDPVHQAVVVWQATNSSDMQEKSFPPTSDYLPGIGYAGEFTDACGSSLGSIRGGSYHVIGMHIGFAPATKVLDGYIALTSYKLKLLQVAVDSARSSNAITKAQYNQLTAHSNDAAKHFSQGLYGPTLNDLQHLEDTINKISIVPQPFNHEGDMEMRTLNLIFTIQAKVVPLSQ